MPLAELEERVMVIESPSGVVRDREPRLSGAACQAWLFSL